MTRAYLRGLRWPRARVGKVPAKPGVYVLYDRTKRVAVGKTFNLRRALEDLCRRGPAFTAFDWFVVLREADRATLAEDLMPKEV